MQQVLPLACFLSLIRPPGVRFEEGLLQIVPINKAKCPFMRDHSDISFLLFTRHNPTVPQELFIGDDEKLFASNIDFTDPTVVYFSAWMEQHDGGSGLLIREAYMLRGESNIIMVDSRHLEAGPWYFTAAQNTWYIGNMAAQFIDYLVSRGLKLSKTHLVGHSLGAQAAGVAGSAIKSGRISRITGLDPALPLFDKLPLPQKLDATDAEFVDVIHTDAGIIGYRDSIGHVDFYPNGGISPQPGCELEVVIPQQQLTPTCDGRTPQDVYTFYLEENGNKNFKTKLIEFFTQIHNLKTNSSALLQKRRDDSLDKSAEIDNSRNKSAEHKTKQKLKKQKIFQHNDKVHETVTRALRKVNSNKNSNVAYKMYDNKRINIKTTEEHTNIDIKRDTAIKDTLEHVNVNIKTELNVDTENPDDSQSIDNDLNTSKTNINISKETNLCEETIMRIDNNNSKLNDVNIDIPNINNKNTHPILTKFNKTHNNATKIEIHDTSIKQTKPVSTNIDSIIQASILNIKPDKNKYKDADEQIRTAESTIKSDGVTTRKKRVRRFISLFRNPETENNNFLFKIIEFLMKNRKNVIPVVTVMREINTLVKSANGELNHLTKERNNYIGTLPSALPTAIYNLELGNDSKVKTIVKRLLGLGQGDKLTITGSG